MTSGIYMRMKMVGTSLTIRMLKPFYKNAWIRRVYWEIYAPEIDRQWGCEHDDFSTISATLEKYRPSSILDVGCGSGRLFGVYTDYKISAVLGIDISEKALSIAKQKFPVILTQRLPVEQISFKKEQFDLVICNRTLQHIPPEKIEDVIRKLCFCSSRIYINEITPTDGGNSDDGLFFHNYATLFGLQKFQMVESGEIPKCSSERQFFRVFKKNDS
jgi:SAM-dependent methyltransferase